MSNVIRIKRRISGAAGAPASLKNAELAFNEVDDVLYYGQGEDSNGDAASIIAIGGDGAFVALNGAQTIVGDKTFTGEVDLLGATVSVSSWGATGGAIITTVGGTGAPASVGDVNAALAQVAGGTGDFVTLATTQTITGDKEFTGEVTVPALGVTASSAGLDVGGVTGQAVSREDLIDGLTLVGMSFGQGLSELSDTVDDVISGVAPVALAGALTTPVNLGFTGDVGGTVSFDGSEGTSVIPVSLALTPTGVTAGQYYRVTVGGDGRVTAGATALASTDIAGFTGDVQSIVDATPISNLQPAESDIDLDEFRVINLGDPSDPQDAATKSYVESVASGLEPKDSVQAASTTNIASLSGELTIDGVPLSSDDRVLVKNQSDPIENGIYVVQLSSWTRATDFDNTTTRTTGAFVFVEGGDTQGGTGWVVSTPDNPTVGTDANHWAQFSGGATLVAGDGLTRTGNVLDVGGGLGIEVDATTVNLTGQALALHQLSSNGIFVRTGTGTVAAREVVAPSGSAVSVSNGSGVSGNISIDVSAILNSIGELSPSSGTVLGFNTSANATLFELGSLGAGLLELDDDTAGLSAGRSLLGLGTMATQDANDVLITGGVIGGTGPNEDVLIQYATIENSTVDGGTF